MRGVTLSSVRNRVRSLLGDDLTIGGSNDAIINTQIETVQQFLADKFEWPFLKTRWSLAIGAGARYTTLPTVTDRTITASIDAERPLKVEVRYNNSYMKVAYGIDADEYNSSDPDLGEVSDPITNWQYADTTKIETWPVGATAQTLRLTGQRQLTTLRDGNNAFVDASLLDLDDLTVALFVAAARLAKAKAADASLILAQANERLFRISAAYPSRDTQLVIGGGWRAPGAHGVKLVGIAAGSTGIIDTEVVVTPYGNSGNIITPL